jgi:hypothetical protein
MKPEELSIAEQRATFLRALKETDGNLSRALAKFPIPRERHKVWLQVDQNYAARVEEIKEEYTDYVEGLLHDLIAKGNITALIFYLKTIGRTRGFEEKNFTFKVNSPEMYRLVDEFRGDTGNEK